MTAFTLVQLTDPHLGAPWPGDAGEALEAAVAAVRRALPGPPDAVLVTGDIASTPAEPEYAQARSLLDGLGAPLYPIPGNHDDRDALASHFELPATAAGGINYSADLGPVRLIALDTLQPGQAGGLLNVAQMGWLERALQDGDGMPTVLAMHHPPLATGLPGLDAIGIPAAERRALAELLARHPDVQLIVAGHVHRTIVGALGATTVLAVPSPYVQLAFDLVADDVALVREPPCFAVHLLAGDRLISHVLPVDTEPV